MRGNSAISRAVRWCWDPWATGRRVAASSVASAGTRARPTTMTTSGSAPRTPVECSFARFVSAKTRHRPAPVANPPLSRNQLPTTVIQLACPVRQVSNAGGNWGGGGVRAHVLFAAVMHALTSTASTHDCCCATKPSFVIIYVAHLMCVQPLIWQYLYELLAFTFTTANSQQ